ncbi:MAG: exosortase K [Acidobacteriota bacterium]
MNARLNLKNLLQLSTIFAIAFALKSFYSTASVNDLRWILAPTASLVELITSTHFEFESHAGYMSSDHTFLIAASCSGVNFLIISFVMLTLAKISRSWPRNIEWRFFPIAMLVAYLTTLLANTTRIVAALSLQKLEIGWLGREEIHRLEGIFVYFGFLFLLFVASERLSLRKRYPGSVLARRSLLPIAIYYAATLGIPLIGGAYRDPAFWRHSLVVFLTPLILMLPWVIFCTARSSDPSEGELT